MSAHYTPLAIEAVTVLREAVCRAPFSAGSAASAGKYGGVQSEHVLRAVEKEVVRSLKQHLAPLFADLRAHLIARGYADDTLLCVDPPSLGPDRLPTDALLVPMLGVIAQEYVDREDDFLIDAFDEFESMDFSNVSAPCLLQRMELFLVDSYMELLFGAAVDLRRFNAGSEACEEKEENNKKEETVAVAVVVVAESDEESPLKRRRRLCAAAAEMRK